MKKWTVPYVRIPTMHNDTHVLVVEAETADAAREIVREHLGDRGNPMPNYDVGGDWYGGAGKITEYVAPPVGRIVGVVS